MRSCSEASLSQDGNSPFPGLSSSCQGFCHSPALFAGTSQARKTGARSDLFSELSSASSPSLMLSADVISLKCRVSLWAPSISSPSQEKLQQALSPTKAPHAAQPAMSAAENSGDTTSPPPETLANLPLRMLHRFLFTTHILVPGDALGLAACCPLGAVGCSLVLSTLTEVMVMKR